MDKEQEKVFKELNKLNYKEREEIIGEFRKPGPKTYDIAIDFDGVIHKYSNGWQFGKLYDGPIEGAIHSIRKILEMGYNIIIFSTRADNPKMIEDMYQWLEKHGLENKRDFIKITNIKPIAGVYIDDRAIRFTNWIDIMKYFV